MKKLVRHYLSLISAIAIAISCSNNSDTFVEEPITKNISIDCKKAFTEVEKMICSKDDLSNSDKELNEYYKLAISNTSFQHKISTDQRHWLETERNKCVDYSCLLKAYTTRLRELRIISDLRQHELLESECPIDQDQLFKDINQRFSKAGSKRILVDNDAYTAINYYEETKQMPGRAVMHYALVKTGEEHCELVLDHFVADLGDPQTFREPRFHSIGNSRLVIFSLCYRGCDYSIFVLNGIYEPIKVENYYSSETIKKHLRKGESMSSEELFSYGDLLRSEAVIYKKGDPTCCPTGGILQFQYDLAGISLNITNVVRKELNRR